MFKKAVHNQNLLHGALLKAVFPLPEDFQCSHSLKSVTNTVKTQPEITCLKLTIETLEQGVKYVQS